MNESIDLTKILKDCPKGTKFYSTIYGEVEFEKSELPPPKGRGLLAKNILTLKERVFSGKAIAWLENL